MSTEVKKVITGQVDLTKLKEVALREGMRPLRISGARKIGAGLTTIEEILKVAPPAQI
jgi:general secretion pathway protein E